MNVRLLFQGFVSNWMNRTITLSQRDVVQGGQLSTYPCRSASVIAAFVDVV